MSGTPPIDIARDQWEIVRSILRRHVPEYDVWAFGSRVRGRTKPFSDLDLAIVAEGALPLEVAAALTDDFCESDLPWKVDVVDWATASEAFRAIIARERVLVQAGRRGPETVDSRPDGRDAGAERVST